MRPNNICCEYEFILEPESEEKEEENACRQIKVNCKCAFIFLTTSVITCPSETPDGTDCCLWLDFEIRAVLLLRYDISLEFKLFFPSCIIHSIHFHYPVNQTELLFLLFPLPQCQVSLRFQSDQSVLIILNAFEICHSPVLWNKYGKLIMHQSRVDSNTILWGFFSCLIFCVPSLLLFFFFLLFQILCLLKNKLHSQQFRSHKS